MPRNLHARGMLRTEDIQHLLGVSRRTVRRLIADGRIRAFSQGPGRGRHMLYSPNSVRDEMERRSNAQPPPP